ncbi:MAG: type II toxin-antitoxin system ParD family antitoxin [Rhodocyclaceae bacterium]|nr:type II toxin-antitoxin system ParD family antitoxin [Rhodocyclaceae bacterium]
MPNVNLGRHFDRFVQEKLTEGRYQNASEVVRAGLRLLEDAEATNLERRAALRAELAERANDGRPTQPATRIFEDLRAHHQSQVKADTHGA